MRLGCALVANRLREALLNGLSKLSLSLLLCVPHFVVDALSGRLSCILALTIATSRLIALVLPASLGSVDLLVSSVHLNL